MEPVQPVGYKWKGVDDGCGGVCRYAISSPLVYGLSSGCNYQHCSVVVDMAFDSTCGPAGIVLAEDTGQAWSIFSLDWGAWQSVMDGSVPCVAVFCRGGA
eukprot:scaffold146996_cov50-Prasinocladus_malaysianus.AAC.2